jgi:replication-associated recombination protein RarA
MFTGYTSNKGLITRLYIYKELKKLNSPKINEPIKKCATELNRTFSKEEVQMTKKKKKTHEKMLTIAGHKGNANQNNTNIPPHSC